MRPRMPIPGGRMPMHGMRPMPPPNFRGPMLRNRLPPPRFAGPRRQPPFMRPGMHPPPMRPMPPPHMMRPMMRPPSGPLFRFGPPPMPHPNRMPRRPMNMKAKIMKNRKFIVKLDLSKPWVTEQIKAEFAKKDKMLATAKSSQSQADWALFREQREVCTKVYNNARKEHQDNNEEHKITQLMPLSKTVKVNTNPIDYTADVIV